MSQLTGERVESINGEHRRDEKRKRPNGYHVTPTAKHAMYMDDVHQNMEYDLHTSKYQQWARTFCTGHCNTRKDD
jgi:hypothetical protein